jgi:hypothetical protein
MRFGKIRDEKHRDDEPVLFSRDQLRMNLQEISQFPASFALGLIQPPRFRHSI